MFKIIYQIISLDNFDGISKEVDILKGINKIPTTVKEAWTLGIKSIKTIKYNGN